MRAGLQGFREPLCVPRVDGVCRPIHPHLAGHLFITQRPPGRFFFGQDECSRLEPRQADRLAAFGTGLRVWRWCYTSASRAVILLAPNQR